MRGRATHPPVRMDTVVQHATGRSYAWTVMIRQLRNWYRRRRAVSTAAVVIPVRHPVKSAGTAAGSIRCR